MTYTLHYWLCSNVDCGLVTEGRHTVKDYPECVKCGSLVMAYMERENAEKAQVKRRAWAARESVR